MPMTSMGSTGTIILMSIRMPMHMGMRTITVIHMTTVTPTSMGIRMNMRIRIVTRMGMITSGMRMVGTPSDRDRSCRHLKAFSV